MNFLYKEAAARKDMWTWFDILQQNTIVIKKEGCDFADNVKGRPPFFMQIHPEGVRRFQAGHVF